jgi:hypothetical protein
MEGWYSTRCKLTWKLKGTKYNRLYFQLQVSALAPTEGTGFGLLPTPRAQEIDNSKERIANNQIDSLPTMAKMGMLPTPRARAAGGNCSNDRGKGNLEDVIASGMLPTPCATDSPDKNTGKRAQDGLQKRAFQTTGKTSQLNPLFVLEMMGFPPNWTELPFLSGETNQ